MMDAGEIFELLEDPARGGPLTSGWQLARAPDAALVAALRAATKTRMRHALCDLLGYREAASAVPALTGLLADDDADVRGAASEALLKIFYEHPDAASPQAREALMGRWQLEPDDGLRRTLVLALGAARHEPFAATIKALLDDPDPGMRSIAVRAFAWHGGARAGPRLLDMFNAEESPYRRASLASLLGRTGYRPAIPALRAALTDPVAVLRDDAADALARLEAT